MGPSVGVAIDAKKKSKFAFKMPKFGLEGHDSDTSDDEKTKTKSKIDMKLPKGQIGVDVNLPKADIEFELPKAEVDVQLPSVDIDVDTKKKSKFGFKIPKFGLEGHESDTIDDDEKTKTKSKINMKLPKGQIGVDVNLPKA